jgi:hypothetical protein
LHRPIKQTEKLLPHNPKNVTPEQLNGPGENGWRFLCKGEIVARKKSTIKIEWWVPNPGIWSNGEIKYFFSDITYRTKLSIKELSKLKTLN